MEKVDSDRCKPLSANDQQHLEGKACGDGSAIASLGGPVNASTEPNCIVRCINEDSAGAETNPTNKNYGVWRIAYEFFNKRLFNNRLPGCLLTFQRQRHTYGFHAGSRFEASDGCSKTDEIALNPSHFAELDVRDVLSTLVHEMAHQYQSAFGKPSQPGYHNKTWARMMIEIGLVPTDTGQPGGKATGRRMTHYIRADGPFDRACAELLSDGFVIPYVEALPSERVGWPSNPDRPGVEANVGQQKADEVRRKKAASKTRYTCPGCEMPKHVWGKPGLHVICGDCDERFEADPTDEAWPPRFIMKA
jgi:hypothetical protein